RARRARVAGQLAGGVHQVLHRSGVVDEEQDVRELRLDVLLREGRIGGEPHEGGTGGGEEDSLERSHGSSDFYIDENGPAMRWTRMTCVLDDCAAAMALTRRTCPVDVPVMSQYWFLEVSWPGGVGALT